MADLTWGRRGFSRTQISLERKLGLTRIRAQKRRTKKKRGRAMLTGTRRRQPCSVAGWRGDRRRRRRRQRRRANSRGVGVGVEGERRGGNIAARRNRPQHPRTMISDDLHN